MKVLFIDHYDSFSFNLVDWLVKNCQRPDFDVIHCFYDRLSLKDLDSYDGVVLSPGPGSPRDYPSTMKVIYRVMEKIPIMGVCLGHQMLGEFFGLQLKRRDFPHHGSTVAVKMGLKRLDVATYHSLAFLHAEALGNQSFMKKASVSMTDHLGKEIYGFFSERGAGWLSCQFHPESYLGDNAPFLAFAFLELIQKNQRRSRLLNTPKAVPHETATTPIASQR